MQMSGTFKYGKMMWLVLGCFHANYGIRKGTNAIPFSNPTFIYCNVLYILSCYNAAKIKSLFLQGCHGMLY